MKTPIKYIHEVTTRFSDLDSYNHVNFKHYLDFVINSRLYFLKKQFNIGLYEIAKLGVGFYVMKAEINYLKPIVGIGSVNVESHVAEVVDNCFLQIPFSISDNNSGKQYAAGKLQFAIVDLKTGKPTQITQQIENLFFENS